MAGTKAGGLKAAKKNLARDPNFYAKIGAKGGKISRRRKATATTAASITATSATQDDVTLAA